MTNTIELEVQKRDEKNANKVRSEGYIPAIVYGPADEPVSIKVDLGKFLRVWHQAGETTIIILKGLDEEKEVLIKDVQLHPVKDLPIHVDFYAIERGKTLTLTVPLEFVGEAEAEKQGGVIVKVLHEVEVETRPRNIPQYLEVDLSLLKDLDSVIKVKDIKTPEGVEILNDKEDIVVAVSEQESEQEEQTQEQAEEEQTTETQKEEAGS